MTDENAKSKAKLEILPVKFTDKIALYRAYMPFVKDGGLFIVSEKPYNYGAKIVLLIELLDEIEKITIQTQVVWITPKGAEGGRLPGIGVQFLGENKAELRKKIETYLSGMPTTEITHTL